MPYYHTTSIEGKTVEIVTKGYTSFYIEPIISPSYPYDIVGYRVVFTVPTSQEDINTVVSAIQAKSSLPVAYSAPEPTPTPPSPTVTQEPTPETSTTTQPEAATPPAPTPPPPPPDGLTESELHAYLRNQETQYGLQYNLAIGASGYLIRWIDPNTLAVIAEYPYQPTAVAYPTAQYIQEYAPETMPEQPPTTVESQEYSFEQKEVVTPETVTPETQTQEETLEAIPQSTPEEEMIQPTEVIVEIEKKLEEEAKKPAIPDWAVLGGIILLGLVSKK